mgnify:CR=1 FL=1
MPVPRKIIGTCCHQGKDTFYRYLNTPTTSWRKLLYRITLSFIRVCASQKSDQSTSGPRCLIFDDTLLPKTGKKAEGITKVYDHVVGKMRLGYKLLGMVYFDGTSSILSDFSLHHDSNLNNKMLYVPAILTENKGKEGTI